MWQYSQFFVVLHIVIIVTIFLFWLHFIYILLEPKLKLSLSLITSAFWFPTMFYKKPFEILSYQASNRSNAKSTIISWLVCRTTLSIEKIYHVNMVGMIWFSGLLKWLCRLKNVGEYLLISWNNQYIISKTIF